MATEQAKNQIPTEWVTIEEAARYLKVSRRTIYRWSEVGRLPVYIIGNHRHRRYKRTDLDSVPRRVDSVEE